MSLLQERRKAANYSDNRFTIYRNDFHDYVTLRGNISLVDSMRGGLNYDRLFSNLRQHVDLVLDFTETGLEGLLAAAVILQAVRVCKGQRVSVVGNDQLKSIIDMCYLDEIIGEVYSSREELFRSS